MQIETKDGIKCDGCGMLQKGDFTYYSIDFKLAKTKYGNHFSLNDLQYADVVETLDYCPKCTEKLKEHVVEVNGRATNRKTGLRYCDLSGIDLMNQTIYYYAGITKAYVKHSGIHFKCDKCGEPSANPEKVCKCGHNHFVKSAQVTTDPRYLEIFLSEKIMSDFSIRKEKLSKEGNNWDVRS